MASLFAALGARLRPDCSDGSQPEKKRPTRSRQNPFLCQKMMQVVAGVAAVAGVATSATVTPVARSCYKKRALEELAEEVLTYRQTSTERYSRVAGRCQPCFFKGNYPFDLRSSMVVVFCSGALNVLSSSTLVTSAFWQFPS